MITFWVVQRPPPFLARGGNSYEQVRRLSAESLGYLGDPRIRPLLEEHTDAYPSPVVQRVSLFAPELPEAS